ncbi:MAG: class I fructose-bisphosphate aldolase [Sphingomonadales bacterium]
MNNMLNEVAIAMGAPGRGILAADESTGTIKKRFDSIGADCTETLRRDYREMLFRTDAMKENISGVILYDETIRQKSEDGTSLINLIKAVGSIPGIKVDKGAHPLAGTEGEKITEGLDGLRERLDEYYELGARFAKWRAVIEISETMPSSTCIQTNVHALARYAALCQEAGIVPIVEPEILMDGKHNIDTCFDVTEYVLKALYDELFSQNVLLEGSVLKPNMVISGTKCRVQAGLDEVAEKTVLCLKRTVPAAVPSVVFLSGGQSDINATSHLNAMNAGYDFPWNLSFSYGRALQAAPLKAWGGNNDNFPAAQAAFSHRARMNGLATTGAWGENLE